MDRASGSGVFARDPDALLDLIELDLTEDLIKHEMDQAVCNACISFLNQNFEDWEDDVSQDAMCSRSQMEAYCKKKLSAGQYNTLEAVIRAKKKKVNELTAWRIEGTLREFPKFAPVNLWFDYPVHRIDNIGVLSDIQPDSMMPTYQSGKEARKKKAQSNREKQMNEFEIAYSSIELEGRNVTSTELAEKLDISKDALNKRLKNKDYSSRFYNDGNGIICRKEG